MDLTKIENIIFISVAGALSAFFLISVFIVVAKGKRKCGAFDVILRILASLTLLVSAVALTASVMTGLDGPFSINVETSVITLWSFTATLPLPELWQILSTTLGQDMCIVLVLLSMLALVCDCLIANAKAKKADKTPKKSAEDIKRQAEIKRIQSIGASAVKKSNSAASEVSRTAETTAVENKAEKADEQKDDEPDFDWRVSPAPAEKEFIGISASSDDFGSFDGEEQIDEPTEEQAIEEDTETETDTFGAYEDDVKASDNAYEDDVKTDNDNAYDDFISEDTDSYSDEEKEQSVAATGAPADEAEPENEKPWYALGGDDEPELYGEQEPTEQETDDAQEEREEERERERERENEYSIYSETDENVDDGAYYGEQEEVNRDIYIPKIRVINRTQPEKTEKEKTKAKKSSGKKPAAKKPTEKKAAKQPTEKQSAKKSAAKSIEQKPAEKQVKPAEKKNAAKKPAVKKSEKAASIEQKPTVKTEQKPKDGANNKSLPVTRRYVILDRTSAVNIFSDYLKERDKDEKNKLESSISTIIIK